MPDPTNPQTDVTDNLIDVAEQYTEFITGTYRRLADHLPEEEATIAFGHLLEQLANQQALQLEEIRLQTRIQELNNIQAQAEADVARGGF